MQLRQENSQRQSQVQKIAPQLIQANTLLQCSTQELRQLIAQEQHENPALESDDTLDAGGSCGHCPVGSLSPCSVCPYRRDHQRLAGEEPSATGLPGEDSVSSSDVGEAGDDGDEDRHAALRETELSHIDSEGGLGPGTATDSEFNPLMVARAPTTMAEQLLCHLRATSYSRVEVQVAEYLVDSLDDRGYLQISMDEACAVLDVPEALILEGIRRLQACDPPGVGARDLRECLLLQMCHRLEQGEPYDPVAQRLIAEHWESLIQRRYAPLARRLGVGAERIEAAISFIQERLTPHPAAQFREPWNHRPDTQSAAVRPDVVIKRTLSGYEVEVLGFESTSLHLNQHYRGLYESIRSARTGGETPRAGGARLSADHEKHVVAYVERANLFLKNLQQRRRTIQKIGQVLIELQQGFLETGQRAFLRPLTRTQLARQVGLHESTVSRALLHKYVQLPSQEVVPFDVFFENAATTKDTVAAMIAEEDPNAPLSDKAIVDALETRGIHVARRTVVKYREELRIPASYLRRRR